MNARLLLFLACLLPSAAVAQGFAGLGQDADGYAQVTAPGHLAFPRDHGAHPDFRIEWWYLTATLNGPDGTDYGVQWTLFRQAMAPGVATGWESPQLWMAHAAATSADQHRFAERFGRGGIGQAGVEAAPFAAWIDDWQLKAPDAEGIGRLAANASGDGFAFDLRLATEQAPVPQGAEGFSQKSPDGQASYYYSQPFYAASGTITLDGTTIPVTGQAWLDREWSSQPLGVSQQGWDWFALTLDDGARVMLFRLRDAGRGAFRAGTWIAADGTPTPLAADDISAEPTAWAEAGGRQIPVAWHLAVPRFGLAVDTTALNAQSWMATTYAYWEGPIRLAGSHAGRGYTELTGY